MTGKFSKQSLGYICLGLLLCLSCEHEHGAITGFREASLSIEFDPAEGSPVRPNNLVTNGRPIAIVVKLHSSKLGEAIVTDSVKWEYLDPNLGSVRFDNHIKGFVYEQTGIEQGHQKLIAHFDEYCADIEFDVSPVEFVPIEASTFIMGRDSCCTRYFNEAPAHVVQLDAYSIGKYEVTNLQYATFLRMALRAGEVKTKDSGPRGFYPNVPLSTPYLNVYDSEINFAIINDDTVVTLRTDDEDKPVVGISWHGAKAFARFYNLMLPTEAQWENACRAGTTTTYFFGNDPDSLSRYAVYGQRPSLAIVGTKRSNNFGLFDMYGNAAEWCNDYYLSDFYIDRPTPDYEPTGPVSSDQKVIRGGNFLNTNSECTSTRRIAGIPHFTFETVGFRVVKKQ